MPSHVHPFLNDFWRDIWTIFGVAGTIATLVGLWVAIVQIRRTATAAEAARAAAERAAVEHRRAMSQFVIGSAHRLVREVTIYVENQSWPLAAVKIIDLADQIAIFSRTADAPGPELVQLAAEFRKWSFQFGRLEAGEIEWGKHYRQRWAKSLLAFSSQLDLYLGPDLPSQTTGNS